MAANSSESSSAGAAKRTTRARKKRTTKKLETALEETVTIAQQSQPGFWQSTLSFSVRERDIAVFLRQLIMLLQAGTPLLRTLQTIAERTERASVRALVTDIASFVEMGNPLWQAFERHPKYFDTVFVNLVKASEASGTLVTVLGRLAKYRERRLMLRRKVQSALVYPLLVAVFCFAVVMLLGKWVLPQFRAVFEQFDTTIPKFTQVFMDTIALFTSGWFLLLAFIVVVALVVLYGVASSKPLWRMRIDRLKLKIPYIGPAILRKNSIVEMCRSFSLLLSSGMSMLATLELTRFSIRNRAVAEIMQDVRDSVEQGEGIEEPLRHRPKLVPPVVTDMLVTGEEAGQLDQIANQIAESYEEEVGISINALGEMVPPVIALIMGVFVLILALAVFVPLITMLEQVQGV